VDKASQVAWPAATVARLYRRALRRYGPADGELLPVRCSKSKPAFGYGTRRSRTGQMIRAV